MWKSTISVAYECMWYLNEPLQISVVVKEGATWIPFTGTQARNFVPSAESGEREQAWQKIWDVMFESPSNLTMGFIAISVRETSET